MARARQALAGVVSGVLIGLMLFDGEEAAEPTAPAHTAGAPTPPLAGLAPSPFPEGAVRPLVSDPAARGLGSVPRAGGQPPDSLDAPAYADDQVMARVDAHELAEVARDHGLRVLRATGPSGITAFGLPRGTRPAQALTDLRDDPRVAQAGLMGLTYGASDGEIEFSKEDHTWPLYQVFDGKMQAGEYSTAGVTIAILDTGLAYEDHSDTSGAYVQAPSLSHVSFVAPYDFVNDDTHPNDDHQHGTHIASIIASRGDVQGAAPDVDLMPIKVLDASNSGTELALLDGLWHAVDKGADVINLSLSFSEGYGGSPELMEAIEAAYEDGILIVAAAGNNGLAHSTWPARSPLVVGVGATRSKDGDKAVMADYSSFGPGMLLAAPGGDLSRDENEDGLPDGILGETIDPEDPTSVDLWLMAGSSQAAAFVSASAAWGLSTGASAYEVLATMQREADSTEGGGRFDRGQGRGFAKVEDKLYEMDDDLPELVEGTVSLLPYLRTDDDEVRPSVQVTWDHAHEGEPRLWISFHGSSNGTVKCEPKNTGVCVAELDEQKEGEDYAAGDALYWWVTVDAAEIDKVGMPTRTALYEGEALQTAVAALDAEVGDDALLGWFWEGAEDEDLGQLAPGVAVVDLGTGFASSPMGLFMNERAVAEWFTVEELELDLDGTGFASSPMGRTTVRVLDGTGFASSPMGIRRIATLDGTGFASSPMGKAKSVHGDEGGRLVDLRGATRDDDSEDTPVGLRLKRGGWRGSGGEPGGASAVATAASLESSSDGESATSGE